METRTDSKLIFPASEATSARHGSGVRRWSVANEKRDFDKGLRERVWKEEREGWGEGGIAELVKWEKGLKVGGLGVLVESG